MQIRNPVIPGFHPDPSVCRVGDDYYLVTSSFEYFPGVPLFHSRDLVHWRQIGHCLTRPDQLPLERCRASGGIYAPTIRHHSGVFYMVTTNVSHGGNFYVTTRDPYDEWSDPIRVDQGGIDPSLLIAEDGRTALFTSNGRDGIYLSEIELATGEKLTETRHIWNGTGGQYAEAPHLYRIGGWYYLMIAEGGTEYGHMETIARSRDPWGPYEPCPHNPVLSHRSHYSPIQATGHADLVQTADGSWWIVFLAVRPNGHPPAHHLGRETFLAPVSWTDDGWPVVGDRGKVAMEMDAPGGPAPRPWTSVPARDEFDSRDLRYAWNFLRNPYDADWSLTERPGWLRLNGSAVSLDDADSPAWLGRRQQHFDCRAATLLEFAPQGENEEAGISIRMNERHRYDAFVTRRGDRRVVVVRKRIGSLVAEVASEPVSDGPVVLTVRADRNGYAFRVGTDGAARDLATGETRYLSTEVAGGFTGVYFALYATGNGKACAQPADFDWFEYEETPVEKERAT